MKRTILLLALFSVIVLLTSCQKGEEITITKYFQSMQANDRDTMAAMAVVPKDVEFKAYKITSCTEPVVTELQLVKLQKELEDLKKAQKDQLNKALDKKDEHDELEFELEETRRRTKKQELRKKLEEVKVELEAEEKKFRDIQQAISKINQAIKAEKNMIGMSANINEKFELYTGETHTSKAIVNVTLTNGESKDYVFLLRKDMMKIQDKALPSRLIITKIATLEEFEQEQQQKLEEQKTETEEVTEEQVATEEQQ
ncbi:MAG: hypothetical protein JSV88_09875 [Candidatus Aminicenantes bacterium]|nr:MAG: hypothetical protein JSV88_09875 [Candidatus Aminicenantes bacterium]